MAYAPNAPFGQAMPNGYSQPTADNGTLQMHGHSIMPQHNNMYNIAPLHMHAYAPRFTAAAIPPYQMGTQHSAVIQQALLQQLQGQAGHMGAQWMHTGPQYGMLGATTPNAYTVHQPGSAPPGYPAMPHNAYAAGTPLLQSAQSAQWVPPSPSAMPHASLFGPAMATGASAYVPPSVWTPPSPTPPPAPADEPTTGDGSSGCAQTPYVKDLSSGDISAHKTNLERGQILDFVTGLKFAMRGKHPKIDAVLNHTPLSLAAACVHEPNLIYYDQWIARNVDNCLDGASDKVKLFRGRYKHEPALLASGVFKLEQIMSLYTIPHGPEMEADAEKYANEAYFTIGMPLSAARCHGQRLLDDLNMLPHLLITPYTQYEEIIKKIPVELEKEREALEREIEMWKSKGATAPCPWPNRETLIDYIASTLAKSGRADAGSAETNTAAVAQAAEAAAAEAAKQQLLTCYVCGGKHIGGFKACNKRCQKCLAFDSTSAGNGIAKICPGARGAACVVTSGEDVQRVVNNALGAPLPTNLRNLLVAANAKHRGIGGKGEANPAEACSAEVSMNEYESDECDAIDDTERAAVPDDAAWGDEGPWRRNFA